MPLKETFNKNVTISERTDMVTYNECVSNRIVFYNEK